MPGSRENPKIEEELLKSIVELGKLAQAHSCRIVKLMHPCVNKLIDEKSRDSTLIQRTLDSFLESMMFGNGNHDFARLVNYYSSVDREGANFYHNYALDDGLLSKMKYPDQLLDLNLPDRKYAIFGSGPLAIRGIRSNQNVDVVVSSKLWNTLSRSENVTCGKMIKKGDIKIFEEFSPILIKNSEKLGDFYYIKLPYILEWKKQSATKKNLRDVSLINEYLSLWRR